MDWFNPTGRLETILTSLLTTSQVLAGVKISKPKYSDICKVKFIYNDIHFPGDPDWPFAVGRRPSHALAVHDLYPYHEHQCNRCTGHSDDRGRV
jgi:hypothetical protein